MISFSDRNPKHSGTGHVLGEKQGGRRVMQIGPNELRSYVRASFGQRPVYVKIDVEGAEISVLKSTLQSLAGLNLRKLVIEVDDEQLGRFGSTRQEIYDLMKTTRLVELTEAATSGHFNAVFG